jgi:hypothetical protein
MKISRQDEASLARNRPETVRIDFVRRGAFASGIRRQLSRGSLHSLAFNASEFRDSGAAAHLRIM